MTRLPIFSTILALIPLLFLAWPLARLVKASSSRSLPLLIEEPPPSSTLRADLEVRSAHPFEVIQISLGQTSWTLTAGEDTTEIQLPFQDYGSVTFTVTVTWPENTPETALLLELFPDGLETRSHTLWGEHHLVEEVNFEWTRNE